MLSELQQALQNAGANSTARLDDYRGATTVSRFGDLESELSALLSGCGVYDLGFRNRISLRGNDRVRWLNGMVTNNVRDLAPDRGVYAFLLTPQGHILGDMYIYNQGESFLVDTDRAQAEKILATFDHYIVMDDVDVRNEADSVTAIGVAGPKARAVIEGAGMRLPQLDPLQTFHLECDCQCGCLDCLIIRGEDPRQESFAIWLAPAHAKALWDSLMAAGAAPIGYEALEVQRILAGIPLYGMDIRERDLPQETQQERALNFNKGCYVGQEIVERIRSRGQVNRIFTGFVTEGSARVGAGDKILSGDKEVGGITSATSLEFAGIDRAIALGYVRREAGLPGREVTIGDTKAVVTQLPFDVSTVLRHEPAAAR